jgi:serine/threonine-protein phosphatase 6 regulatory ankyrin repeat subunit A
MISRTPLHFALAKSGNYDICRALLKHGADLGSRDVSGKTPLHTFFSPAVGMILTNHREAIDDEIMTADTAGMTILQYVAWSSKSQPEHLVPYLQCGEIYPFLARDYAGRSLLHFAAQRGNTAILKYFLSLPHDAGLKIRDISGQSVLHYAVHSKRTEVIDLLISNGADINVVDKKGRTILHCAAVKNNLAAIERVVALVGRDSLYLRDHYGRTPAELAHRYKAFEAESRLKSLTAEVPDCMGHPHPPPVESKSGSPVSLTCYTCHRPLKLAHIVILVIVLLWYTFRIPRE